jgi:hypothetical protein
MTRGASPPCEKGAGRVAAQPARDEINEDGQRVINAPGLCNAYEKRLIRRVRAGLLEWFVCSICGAPKLDPIGYDGPGRWLCEACVTAAERLELLRRGSA